MSVEGLRIVVTGASSGLGAHTVRHLVAGGALVLAAQVAPISAASIGDPFGRQSAPRGHRGVASRLRPSPAPEAPARRAPA
jgi:NAD(P)-dependent dehydrogenase (short-subunit alcohol dehydrogenase family)